MIARDFKRREASGAAIKGKMALSHPQDCDAGMQHKPEANRIS